MKKILLASLVFFMCNCNSNRGSNDSDIIFNVKKILSKSPEDVIDYMGQPDSSYVIKIVTKEFPAHRYFEYQTEIIYIAGKANEIVIYEPHKLLYEISSLERFGVNIKRAPDDHIDNQVTRWYGVDGINTIAMYDPQYDSLDNLQSFTIFFKAKSE
jgi:hypothetical protein